MRRRAVQCSNANATRHHWGTPQLLVRTAGRRAARTDGRAQCCEPSWRQPITPSELTRTRASARQFQDARAVPPASPPPPPRARAPKIAEPGPQRGINYVLAYNWRRLGVRACRWGRRTMLLCVCVCVAVMHVWLDSDARPAASAASAEETALRRRRRHHHHEIGLIMDIISR